MIECFFVLALDGALREPDSAAKSLWFPAAPRIGELVALKDATYRVTDVLWTPKGVTAVAVICVKPVAGDEAIASLSKAAHAWL